MEDREMNPKDLLIAIKKELEALNRKANEIQQQLQNIEGLIPRKKE